MAGVTGAEITYGAKKATTWGTAVALGAGNGFMGLPWTADPDNSVLVDDSLGVAFAVDSSPGQTKLEPNLNGYLRFNDQPLLSLLAGIFGTAAAPSTHAGGTLSKDHTLKIARSTDGIFFTLAALMGTLGVEEIPSFKPGKLVITLETGKPAQYAISGPGIDLVTGSLINTTGTFASVTVPEKANRCYMGMVEVRINDQSAVALTGSHKIAPSKVVLTLERKLTGVYGAYNDAGAGRDLIDEPSNDGLITGSLDLTFPRMADFSGRSDILAHTSKKCEIIITSKNFIEGAIPYQIKFQLPHLKPRKNANPHKQGIIENTRSYDLLGATTAPAGMTGNTDLCWAMLTNTITTSLLV